VDGFKGDGMAVNMHVRRRHRGVFCRRRKEGKRLLTP
jgi:hypothetical protein